MRTERLSTFREPSWFPYRVALTFAALMLAAMPTAFAAVWYVDKYNATGIEDGLSWATAYTTIQPAIDKAHADGGGDVWIAEGVYDERRSHYLPQYPNVDTNSLSIGQGIRLFGGFAGNETSFDGRDWERYECIIDGFTGGRYPYARCVVRMGDGSILDGFKIKRGNAFDPGLSYHYNQGGGINADGDNIVIRNCVFTNNAASEGGEIAILGTALVENCLFRDENSPGEYLVTNYGGGIYIGPNANGTILNSRFSVDRWHDTLACITSSRQLPSSITLRGCVFEMNGGGAIGVQFAHLEVTSCLFHNSWTRIRDSDVTRLVNSIFRETEVHITAPGAQSETLDILHCDIYRSGLALLHDDVFSPRVLNNIFFRSNVDSQYETGNFVNIDPRFLGPAENDFRIIDESHAVDAAEPLSSTEFPGVEFDFAGNPRPHTEQPDMGALENDGTLPTQVWYVDKDNLSGREDGLSWETAFREIQPALDAPGFRGWDEVWIAQGDYDEPREGLVYTPYSETPIRSGSLIVAKPMSLFGGFSGQESSPTQRDVTSNPVVIDGSKSRDGSPAYSVVFNESTDNSLTMDGVVIAGGVGSVSGEHNMFAAAGITNFGPILDLRNCTVRDNYGDEIRVGGLAANAVSIRDCVFENNMGGNGAALAAGGAHVGIYHSKFVNNRALHLTYSQREYVVAVVAEQSDILDCTFVGNEGEFGGALTYVGRFASNVGEKHTLSRCSFIGNTSSVAGGAVYSSQDYLTVSNCWFWGNRAVNGSAVAFAGSYYYHPGLKDDAYFPVTGSVVGCTFVNNVSTMNDIVHSHVAYVTVANSLMSQNFYDGFTDSWYAPTLYLNSMTDDPAVDTVGIAIGSAQFVDIGRGDLRLLPDSPGIDVARVPPTIDYADAGRFDMDFEGTPRPQGTEWDIGAYEYAGQDFAPLTVTVSGGGRVTPAPGTYGHYAGDAVTFTAAPADGWVFSHWGGSVEESENPLTIMLHEQMLVTAIFSPNLSLTMAQSGEGSVSPALGSHRYVQGQLISLSATPSTGWLFSHWGGVMTGAENPVDFTIEIDSTVVAVFIRPGTVSVSILGEGSVQPSEGEHSYLPGELVSFEAIPAEGWVFDRWTGGVSSAENPLILTITSSISIVAQFKQQFALTVDTIGAGSTSPAAGVHNFVDGDSVTIAAMPDAGWVFAGWAGDVSSAGNPLTLTIAADTSVSAIFRQQFSLSMNGIGEGTTSPAAGVHNFVDGDSVTITAIADEGWVFEGWSGSATGSENPLTLLVDGDESLTAEFSKLLALSTAVTGEGVVQIDGGERLVRNGETIEIGAISAPGWVFSHWEGDHSDTSNPATFAMTSDIEVRAVFLKRHALSIGTRGGGTVTPGQGPHAYIGDTEIAITATPLAGWYFRRWEGDASGDANPLTFGLTRDATVIAAFERLLPFEMQVRGEGEILSELLEPGADKAAYRPGDRVRLTAVPAEGWLFVRWEGDLPPDAVATDPEIVLSVDSAIALTAVFEPAGLFGCSAGESPGAARGGDSLLPFALVLLLSFAGSPRVRRAAGTWGWRR